MPLPTVDQFLTKLEADPQAGRDFDAATRAERPFCATRREACEHLLASLRAKSASLTANTESKRQALLATKAKAAAIEAARKSQSIMKTSFTPTPATTTITAAAFAKPQMTMLRSEWQNLSNKDKSRFFAEGGKLAQDPEPAKPLSKGGQLTREGLRALSPQAQNAYFAKGGRLAE
jgi:hypothetical protein